MSSNPYPGREFVATLDCYPQETFGDRCDRLISLMEKEGIQAECPGIGIYSGILVPVSQVQKAKAFLRGLRLDWIIGWICEDSEPQGFQFGWHKYQNDKKA
jgi:hypothetical protein